MKTAVLEKMLFSPWCHGAGYQAIGAVLRALMFPACVLLFSFLNISLVYSGEKSEEAATGSAAAASFAYYKEVNEDGKKTILSLKFDGKPDYRLFFMEDPARFVIELESADFRLGTHASDETIGLVASSRNGKITQDKSRMVITLSQTAKLVSEDLQKEKDSSRHTLSLALEPVEATEFAAILESQRALHGASGEAVVKGGRVRSGERKQGHFTIVIDPGHGGIDGGAKGATTNMLEKDIVLDIAKLLGKLIEESGPFHVLYTRETDIFVSLRERQNFTRRNNADLMISLHADSLRQRFVRGATVYTLAKRASDSLSRQLAESENLSDVVAGMAAPEAQDDVSNILADLTLRETTRFSRSFSASLVEQLKNRIELINNPRRSASFIVLKNAENPSVLVELGYLSNKEDEAQLTDPEWQSKTAALIAETVREFFAGKQPLSQAN